MSQDDPLYKEPYRLQYHFSPPCRWMNDPNGMVYYEGEYHLFYQFHPQDTVWGPMHWGHAVSQDLVHWENLPIALYPDALGTIWSGSAVVDANNTSGLVPGGGLVAIFTYQDQSQGIAFSTDRGRTWTKYAGNPVIPALAKDFRDPKVIWYAPTEQWIMVIAAGKEVQFFGSPDLIKWEHLSDFSGGHTLGVWEVPDLFPLQVDETGITRWVLLVSVSTMAPASGGGVQCFIGDFDGRTFTTAQTEVLWLDYGPDNYAGTTWSDLPDGRRVYIGWLNNWQYAAQIPTSVWRGAATLPRELQLKQTLLGTRLVQSVPVAIQKLRTPLGSWENLPIDARLPLDSIKGRRLEIEITFELGTAERFGVEVHRGEGPQARVVYNTTRAQLLISRGDAKSATREAVTLGGYNPVFGAPVEPENNRVRLHIFVDESSLEVFAQEGRFALSSQIFVDPTSDGMALFAEGGTVTVASLKIYALNSIWPSPEQAVAAINSFNYCL